jgi:hypothetical protein
MTDLDSGSLKSYLRIRIHNTEKYYTKFSSRIPDSDFFPIPDTDPGAKKLRISDPGPQHLHHVIKIYVQIIDELDHFKGST